MALGTRTAALACGLGLGIAGAGAGAAGAEAAPHPPTGPGAPSITWKACPQYSDDVLTYLRIRPTDFAKFRALWSRTECGTVSVPLDYRDPDGPHIDIALTRLKAQDQAHRRGVLFMNPGGPGGSGYLMPATLSLESPTDAQLNEDYDLIGVDPRGIGYSTSFDCPAPEPGAPVPPGPLTRAEAEQLYDRQAAANTACSSADPAFLKQLTTPNAARDLDTIRRALHESRAGYFGASWGTQLGAVYRSMFPSTIDRMWLDSVVSPDASNLAYRFTAYGAATEADFDQFAIWLAAHDGTYGLGTTPQEVTARVEALHRQADAHPWKFTDIPAPLDGTFISFLASAENLNWVQAATILQALTTATSGGPAPASVTPVVGVPGPLPTPPAGAPEQFNTTANQAYLCNEDTSPRGFEPLWAEYQRGLRENPVTGEDTGLRPTCAGWKLPAQPVHLRWSPGSLEMSGHEHETSTPYPWVRQMQDAIGGEVFTVKDYVHGSAPFAPECASHILDYFDTGKADSGSCDGIQPGASPGIQPFVWMPGNRMITA